MRAILKKIVRPVISLGLTSLFLYLAFRDTDFNDILESLSRANYLWALSMLPVLLLSHAARALRWRYLLRPVKKAISFRNLFLMWLDT